MNASRRVLAKRFIDEYWSYYLQIENDVIDTFNYVEPDIRNFIAFSRKYKDLLSSIGSEVDVVGKSIAELIDTNDNKLPDSRIAHWGYVVEQRFPGISSVTIDVRGFFQLTPWNNWANEKAKDKNGRVIYRLKDGSSNPEWWRAYNKTKHRRRSLANPEDSNYERANLKNVLNGLAGLFALEITLAEVIGHVPLPEEPQSKLFKLIDTK